MTLKQIERTCQNDGWTVFIEKREKQTCILLKKEFSRPTPPLLLTLQGRTCKDIIDHLRRLTEEFDIDRETYRHLNSDGHGFGGYPQHINEVYKTVRFHKDEMNRLLIDCSDTILPVGSSTIPGYEFRRRTKDMLKKCFDSTDRLIDRVITEGHLDRNIPNANLLTVSTTKAILRWMGEKFKPGFPIAYNKQQEILANEQKIYTSLK